MNQRRIIKIISAFISRLSFLSPLLTSLMICTHLIGCANRLEANPFDTEQQYLAPISDAGSFPSQSGEFRHQQNSDGSHTTFVNASDYKDFQRLDLDSGLADDAGWDIAIRRFLVLSNGGVSGNGGVQILLIEGTNFDQLRQAPGPEGDWQVDQNDGPADEGSDPDNLFNNGVNDWYEYDSSDHSLTPRDFLYIIRSTEKRYYKLQLQSYYDKVGTPANLTMNWAEISPPEEEPEEQQLPVDPNIGIDSPNPVPTPNEPGLLVVNASSYEDFVYISVKSGITSVTSPNQNLDWDIAVRRYQFLTNSGTSGAGFGGALLDDSGISFEELNTAPLSGYIIDEILPADGSPGSQEGNGNLALQNWYDYAGLGSLSPKNQNYIIRTAKGDYAKLHIISYVGGIFEMNLLALPSENP